MRELRTATVAVLVMTAVLGLAYPLAMTSAAQVLFPAKADGDRTLIGRDFATDPGAFQSRPSVTGHDPENTFFNNQGPNQKALAEQLRGYVKDYLQREKPFTPGLTAPRIPPDAVTTSGSGVDPQISEANARIQANRVAKLRGLPVAKVMRVVDAHTSRPLLGLGGARSVNVLEVNLALEGLR